MPFQIDREEKFWFEAAHVNAIIAVVEAEAVTASPELRNRLMSLAAFARRANPTGSNAGLRGVLHSIRMRCRICWATAISALHGSHDVDHYVTPTHRQLVCLLGCRGDRARRPRTAALDRTNITKQQSRGVLS
jgi:hypothetical protein